MWTVRITRTGLQKIQCLFTKCHYTVFKDSVWCAMNATGNIMATFSDHTFTLICFKQSDNCADFQSVSCIVYRLLLVKE